MSTPEQRLAELQALKEKRKQQIQEQKEKIEKLRADLGAPKQRDPLQVVEKPPDFQDILRNLVGDQGDLDKLRPPSALSQCKVDSAL